MIDTQIDLLEGKYAKYLKKGKAGKQKDSDKIKAANKAYTVEFKYLKSQLNEINKLIDGHMSNQRKDPLNWKFVGDVSSWNGKLGEVIQSLKEMKVLRR